MSFIEQHIANLPIFRTLEDIYMCFEISPTDEYHEHREEIIKIFNRETVYEPNMEYPPYMYSAFADFGFTFMKQTLYLEIAKKAVSLGYTRFLISIYAQYKNMGMMSSAKRYLKKAMDAGISNAFFIKYRLQSKYLHGKGTLPENVTKKEVLQRGRKMEKNMCNLCIAISENSEQAMNYLYDKYLYERKRGNPEFKNITDIQHEETTKMYADLNCKQAMCNYAVFCAMNGKLKDAYEMTLKVLNCYHQTSYRIATYNAMGFAKEQNGKDGQIVDNFFTIEEFIPHVERLIVNIGDCVDIVDVIEYHASKGNFDKCNDYLQIMWKYKEPLRNLFQQLYPIVEKYDLSIPFMSIFEQYRKHCNNVVAEYECQFCMEDVTNFIHFGCVNAEHGCCKTCYKKCSFCPYKCEFVTVENK